ncbi:hypothetical protein PR002_g17650, partial [Phytophthora rubi]
RSLYVKDSGDSNCFFGSKYFPNYEYCSNYEFFSSLGPSSGFSDVAAPTEDFRGTATSKNRRLSISTRRAQVRRQPAVALVELPAAARQRVEFIHAASAAQDPRLPSDVHNPGREDADRRSSSSGVDMDSGRDIGPERPLTFMTPGREDADRNNSSSVGMDTVSSVIGLRLRRRRE